jgi:phosphoglycolate phosphatase
VRARNLAAAVPQGLARPQAILFDWDNTLVDSWATIHEALNLVMTAMEKPLWSLRETKERVRLSLRESFPLHFGDRWEEARQIYLDFFGAIHLDRLSPLPGRLELLRGLAADGIFLGVVSNKTGALLRREAERIGWSELFGSIVGAGDAALDKPDPAPVTLALHRSGVEAGEAVWFVGDTGSSSRSPPPCFTLCGACDSPARAHLGGRYSAVSSERFNVNWAKKRVGEDP